MDIGFIGIGVMGESMARHLLRAGHSLTVYNRTKSKAEKLLGEGAAWAESAGACARGQDVVITIVGFPKDVEEVYLGEGGILQNAKPGATLIDMTTTSPALWQRIAAEAQKRGLHPLDAPVSGGDSGARNATLSIMVGGAQEDFEAMRPLFACMGKSITLTGGPGCGQHTKMANQIAIAGCVAGVAEAIRYGEAGGLDIGNMLGCISAGAAGSWQMSNNGPKMAAGDYAPGFFIKHFIKDMRIAVEEAEKSGASLPVLAQVLSMYEGMQARGQGDLGTQAIIEAYRKA
ncbi:MAG: NAD(P)-dependent oxidoreductase [Clostridiales bacterium]|nr:NAD(P)-dependent oxidoreductase [Clostridiales bacterium]MDO4351332.1 NAD(P)-dependent oxidoreductase [Eubacteriales bacterium]MDY4007800.1 NAD(P)-dependent oxidoreductase [Candidatus Limiplasma sp.]